MRLIMTMFYLLLILIGISFAALNASSIPINFYFTTFHLPISVLVLLMLGAGSVLGFVLFLSRYWRLKAEYRKIKTQLKLNEKEIKNLRAIPLQDEH